LLDYISQLLGTKNVKVQQFVENVGRFQRGETIKEVTIAELKQEEKPRSSSIAKLTPLQKKPATPKKPSNEVEAATNKSTIQAVPKSKPDPKFALLSKKEPRQAQQSKKEEPRPPTKRSAHPQRGKAKFECGCFGNYHKPLTNCL